MKGKPMRTPRFVLRGLLWIVPACALTTCLFPALEQDTPPPSTPIFSDVERIELTSPPHNGSGVSPVVFQFDAPSEVSYLVLALFDAQIQVVGSRIVNEGSFSYGSRSGLSGFSRSSISSDDLYSYDPVGNDLAGAPGPPAAGTYYWAVWGYDKWGNLTHASPQWIYTFN